MLKLYVDIPYNTPNFFASFNISGESFNISFSRAHGDIINNEISPTLSHYYFQIYKSEFKEGEPIKPSAYLYFYLDFSTKETKYIGTHVSPEHRNKGFASLLAALWTWICMENNFYNYVTTKKQRKPFLIYILKLYGFEIPDIKVYDTYDYTIYVCRDLASKSKCLYFKNANHAETFRLSNAMKKDNYKIIDSESLKSGEIELLTPIIVNTPYELQDFNKAYTRSLKILESFELL